MSLTKAELEDIWNNKPVGYLKDYMKKIKSTKLYDVQVQPFRYDYMEKFSTVVRAKNRDEAYRSAQEEFRSKDRSVKIDGWRLIGANAK